MGGRLPEKINTYVYRSGNGEGAQTWPLIRQVKLEGPWHVLQTGACLVDLPGVRDANAARAKVAEQYLQNCNEIWIVAPIKRAVDDGTAKELLGESFKRRLLMDGNYGSVSFICTQTDDIEATETMRDHADVAQDMGLWTQMVEYNSKIQDLEHQLQALEQQGLEYEAAWEDAKDTVGELHEELVGMEEEADEMDASDDDYEDDEDDTDDNDRDDIENDRERLKQAREDNLAKMRVSILDAQKSEAVASLALERWRLETSAQIDSLKSDTSVLQKQLKPLCALVRNQYSKQCLQDDFRAGLDELTRKPDEEEEEEDQSMGDSELCQAMQASTPVPDDFQMNVYTISSNDFLKITGIKPRSDGPPNTFVHADDTQIPALQAFVHETTAKMLVSFSEACVNSTSDLLERVQLVASDNTKGDSQQMSLIFKQTFDAEMRLVTKELAPVVQNFQSMLQTRVDTALKPSLKKGATKAQKLSTNIVQSWGSKQRRNRGEKDPEKNGLFWSTYNATVRRDGVYVSGSAGEIDFNQELCDPMEKEFSADWQRVFDSSLRQALLTCENKVLAICATMDRSLAKSLAADGVGEDRLRNMITAANRSCKTNLTNTFAAISSVATNSQKDLNRSLLPLVKERMVTAYKAVLEVPGGSGRFMRMKGAMESQSQVIVHTMFTETTTEMLTAIGAMVTRLSAMIAAAADIIRQTFEGVYSVLWEGNTELLDPQQLLKIRECRERLIPTICKIQERIAAAMKLLGMRRI